MRIFLASSNAHKAREISQILGTKIECFVDKNVIESGTTFAQNAVIKATSAVNLLKSIERDFLIIADDSGIDVDTLYYSDNSPAPSLFSARFSHSFINLDNNFLNFNFNNLAEFIRLNSTIDDNLLTLIFIMVQNNIFSSTARFRCALNLQGYKNDKLLNAMIEEKCEGKVDISNIFDDFKNAITNKKIDENLKNKLEGFGYDPIFYPRINDNFTRKSFANLANKNALSHRGKAMEEVKKLLSIYML